MSSVAVPVSSLPRPSAAELRRHLEAELADRIPGALSPHERVVPEMASSGIAALDQLTGGWPRGTLSELFGPASSGRTTLLVAALAAATARGEACALIDAGDTFDPASAAAAGVDLAKLLWIRCGKHSPRRHEDTKKKGLQGSHLERSDPAARDRGVEASLPSRKSAVQFVSSASRNSGRQFGSYSASPRLRGEDFGVPEPRDIGIWGYGDSETMERINPALARKTHSPRSHEDTKNSGFATPSARRVCFSRQTADASQASPPRHDKHKNNSNFVSSCLRGEKKYRAAYARIEQALKAADLLLGGGGFGLVAIDLAGLPPEAARRVPLTTWFRFRRAVEPTATVLLVVSPQPLTQSCAALAVKLQPSAKTHHRDTETQRIFGVAFLDCHHEDATASEGSAFRSPDPPITGSPDRQFGSPSHAQLLTGFRLRAEVVRSPLPGRKRPQAAHTEIITEARWA